MEIKRETMKREKDGEREWERERERERGREEERERNERWIGGREEESKIGSEHEWRKRGRVGSRGEKTRAAS